MIIIKYSLEWKLPTIEKPVTIKNVIRKQIIELIEYAKTKRFLIILLDSLNRSSNKYWTYWIFIHSFISISIIKYK